MGEMLSVLVVCEWSYFSWAQRVLSSDDFDAIKRKSSGEEEDADSFMYYEWIELHSGEGFESVVEHFRSLLDKEGRLMAEDGDEEGKERCEKRFLEAIALEEAFFEDAYKE